MPLDHGRRLDPALQTTPTGSPAGGELPDDVALEAARRLRTACLVFIGLWAILLLVNHLVAPLLALPLDQVLPWPPIADVLAVGSILLSLLVYRSAPSAARRGSPLVTIALGYEIALGLVIGLINQWQPQVLAGRLSWLCVLILAFPAIVPGPPRKVLFASLVVATMDPVGLLVARLRGLELDRLGLLIWAYLPNYICAALAVLPSHLIQRLGRKVRQARELGSYRLVERIGRGGMGEVWKAEHRMLARPAAIKLIRAERLMDGSDLIAQARFRREADAAASLRSPHTIQLYDFGITREHELYYVMELLEGIDLDRLVAEDGAQPPARVVHILRQACRSLAEAHAAGLVHRDIKPANLHLSRLGLEYDFVKVLDFGLVKGQTRGGQRDLRLTAPESATGTPAYMPPEMASGEPVDGRTDLYALGCVGYYLLTGCLVFEGETPMQVILKHLQAEPVPPSVRVGRTMPPGLERLILDCLAKERPSRPAGAAELDEALGRCDAGSWSQADAREWWESRTAAAVAPPGAAGTTRRIVPVEIG
jgi:tRNA A-37 threonylcarbamoyl transferase component Bud32